MTNALLVLGTVKQPYINHKSPVSAGKRHTNGRCLAAGAHDDIRGAGHQRAPCARAAILRRLPFVALLTLSGTVGGFVRPNP